MLTISAIKELLNKVKLFVMKDTTTTFCKTILSSLSFDP